MQAFIDKEHLRGLEALGSFRCPVVECAEPPLLSMARCAL